MRNVLEREMPTTGTDGHCIYEHSTNSNSQKVMQGGSWELLGALFNEQNTADFNYTENAIIANLILTLLLPHKKEAREFYLNFFVALNVIDFSCAQNISMFFEGGKDA